MSNTLLEIAYGINRSADLWWQSLGHAAVQVGIVATLGLVLVSLARRWSSSLRYGILVVLLLKFLLAPVVLLWSPGAVGDLLTVEVPVHSDAVRHSIIGSDEPTTSAVLPAQALSREPLEPATTSEMILPEPASLRDDPRLWSLITPKGWGLLAHLAGSAIVVLWLLCQGVRLAVWTLRRSEPAPFPIQSLSLAVQRELRYFKRLDVRVGAEAGSPMAFQLLQPVIVLPQRTVEALSEDELRPVLAHEIAHLKRRDPLVNTLQILLFGVWWFHPVYWWLNRKLRSVREECCDDAVLSLAAQREDRYCQTLLDAARSCQAALAGRVALGFGESGSSMKRRIVRIMDPRVRKRTRLGWLAAAVLVLVVVASLPMWRTSSSLEHPRPVTEVEYGPGMLESLLTKVGLRRYSELFLDSPEFAALEDCIEQSRLTNSSTNGVTHFERPSTHDALMELRAKLTEPFYADFLLAKWYEVNGEPNDAARWMAQALADAPVVLVRRYELMDGRPLANAPVGSLGIEYRMSTPSLSNTYLVLDYINLTTDEQGQVYLPGYDTKIRCNGTQWPRGYDIEAGRHGYLALHGRYNFLPTIYAWPKDLPRPATTLPTSEFYDYRDAVAAQGLTHRVGLADLRIDRCYRLGGAGRVTVTDGRESIDAPPESLPTFTQQSPALDQGLITFERSTLKTHEILQVRAFDHDSRTLLLDYHAPADYEYDGDSSISLRSLGAELPARVDVWFWVSEFSADQGKQIMPAQVGGQADFGSHTVKLRALHAGLGGYATTLRPDGTRTVKFGLPNDPNAQDMQAAFEIEARERMQRDRYGRVAAVTKDGRRYFSSHVIRAVDDLGVHDFYVPLAEVDHFELLPIGDERCFYFDGVLLPERSGGPLDKTGTVEFEVTSDGRSGRYVSDARYPIRGAVTVLPGRGGMSMGLRQGMEDPRRDFLQWEPSGPYRDIDTYSTVVCELSGLSERLLSIELLDLSGNPLLKKGGGRSATLYYQHQAIPVEQIQGVRVRLSRDNQW